MHGGSRRVGGNKFGIQVKIGAGFTAVEDPVKIGVVVNRPAHTKSDSRNIGLIVISSTDPGRIIGIAHIVVAEKEGDIGEDAAQPGRCRTGESEGANGIGDHAHGRIIGIAAPG